MPHGIVGPTGFGGRQRVLRSGTTAANIRYLIDTRGFVEAPHARQVASSGSFSGILPVPPSLYDTTPWGDIIKDQIDKLWNWWSGDDPGAPMPFQENGNGPPIPGGLMVPEEFERGVGIGMPRGAQPFVTLANGMTGCPSGYHPEKQGKPYCVRNRRMNALNPRALSRASRRVGGFARAVKRARTLKRICKTL